MSDFLLNANKLCAAAREQQAGFSVDDIGALRIVYDNIVREGERANPAASGRVKQSTTVNLLRRLRQYGDAILRFVGDFSVPFTNNTVKRAVRMPK